MNNAWSIASRLPCRGITTPLKSQWAHPIYDGLACRTAITSAIAQERQQSLRRGFSSASWQLAKKLRKVTKPTAPPPSVNRFPAPPRRPPPQKQDAPVKQETKAPEKTQVQLSQAQVASILGNGVTFDQGMDLLQEFQYRRVTGSLSDKGIEWPERIEFTADHRSRALEWLRETYPVDEEAASFEYAEELAQTEREQLQERAKKLRLYKREEGEEVTKEEEEEEIYINEEYDKIPKRPDQTQDITSESALTARKEYVEASRRKAKIEAEKVAEEYEARGEKRPEPYRGHDLVVAKKTELEDTRKIKHDRWDKLAKEAELDIDEIQKDRSAFDRLWRPVAFGLAVAYLSWVWAESYEPPKSSMRVFPSISPGTATIAVIAGLNLLVLLMWRHPNAWKMMNRNFMLSPGNPKAFSIVGSMFSHQTLQHLMWNMSGLWVVGSLLHEEVGRGAFLSIYLSSGILGYLASLSINVFTKSHLSATLGASAAVFGVIAAFCTVSPTRTFFWPDMLGGPIEYSAWIPLIVFAGLEVMRWRMNFGIIDGALGSGTDHMSHLGGIVAGAIYGFVIRKRLEAEKADDDVLLVQKPSSAPATLGASVTTSAAKV